MTNNVRQVPFFKYSHTYGDNKARYREILEDICTRGAFILQKEVDEFEKKLAEFVGCKHAIGVANATDALYLSLLAAGVGRGDEVIFCSHTYVATASSIHFAGAKPVPVDCGPDHQMDPLSLASAITSKTKAIMPTQLNGRICPMDEIMAIAGANNLIVIEDSAQGLGARYNNMAAGTFGLAGVISFYPAKTLGCFGDGGAVLTNDDEVCEKIKLLRFHGRDHTGAVTAWGMNSRLDNLHAAILIEKLSHIDHEIKRRREIAKIYNEILNSNTNLALPEPPVEGGKYFDVFQNYEIRAQRRNELKSFLANEGVGTLIQWGGTPVHKWSGLGFSVKLPYVESLFESCIMLPMNTSLTDEDVLYVAEKVNKFYDTL